MQSLMFDLRHILRSLLNHPIFSLAVILMLSLGIGLVLFMFGVIQSLVLQEPPYDRPEQIAHIELANTATGARNLQMGVRTYLDFARLQVGDEALESSQFEQMAAYYVGTVNFSLRERARRLEGSFVSADLFNILGAVPLAGRGFTAEDLEPGAEPVVVIGYLLWKEEFSLASPDPKAVLNKIIRVNGKDSRIIGVMAEGFRFPLQHDIWVPMDLDVRGEPPNSGNQVNALGRLKPGSTMAAAQADLLFLLTQLNAEDYLEHRQADQVVVKPLGEEMVSEVYAQLFSIMMLAVMLVLLVACTNVGGLLGARAATRQRERTIRSVLGASRGRLLWEGLLEALLLTGLAGVIGLFLASIGITWFLREMAESPNPPPSWALEFTLNPMLVGATVAAVLLTAIFSGLYPAWRASRESASQIMREGGNASISSGIGRVGRYLISVEIAVSLALLVGAGLIIRTVWNIQHVDIGADVTGVMTGRIALLDSRYSKDGEYRVNFLDDLLEELRHGRMVRNATLGSTLPMTNASSNLVHGDLQDYRAESELPSATPVVVAANYFQFFGIPLLHGENFDGLTRQQSEPVVIISRSLNERLWGSEPGLNHHLYVKNEHGEFEARRVIGVVGDVEFDGEDIGYTSGQKLSGAYYIPFWQSGGTFWSLAVSGDLDLEPAEQEANLREFMAEAVANKDSDLPVYWDWSMEHWLARAVDRHNLFANIFLSFGFSALGLSAAGLYSLLAFTVTRRTREIGVHRALGAPSWKILRAVLRESMVQLLIGAVFGLVLSIQFARALQDFLFQVPALDPLSFMGAVLFFAVVCVSASLVPAIRAIRISPMQALRYE